MAENYNGLTGTYTLEYLKTITNKTVREFGMEDVAAAVAAEVGAHNARLTEGMRDYVTVTSKREMPDATGQMLTDEMVLADEFGRAPTQVSGKPGRIGLPLERFKIAKGFTTDFLSNATVAQVAMRTTEVEAAHIKRVTRSMRDALYRPVSFDFVDYRVDDMVLKVKPLYNADGVTPVNGPAGETFDGAHTHFMTAATLTAAAVDALIENVAEHNDSADVVIQVSLAEAAAVRKLDGFAPIMDARIEQVPNGQFVARGALNTGNIKNRKIGYYNGAEVWVKPWSYAGYLLALDRNAPQKALGMRESEDASKRGLRLIATNYAYPLQSENFEAEFGFGALSRGAAAVLQITAAGAYEDPTAK